MRIHGHIMTVTKQMHAKQIREQEGKGLLHSSAILRHVSDVRNERM